MSQLSYSLLDDFAVIHVGGADAGTFLGAQVTSDLPVPDKCPVTYSAYCNPKGRVIATFWLIARDGGYTLVLPGAMTDILVDALGRYVLRAKVEIERQSGVRVFGLIGPGWRSAPAAADGHTLPGERSLLLAAQDEPAGSGAFAGARRVDPGAWHARGIEQRIAMVHPQTTSVFVPQHIGLEGTGALSFTKGCYPGQEVVARLHYLGRSKQTMKVASGATDPAVPGSPVYDGPEPGNRVGTVIESFGREGGETVTGIALPVEYGSPGVWISSGGRTLTAELR